MLVSTFFLYFALIATLSYARETTVGDLSLISTPNITAESPPLESKSLDTTTETISTTNATILDETTNVDSSSINETISSAITETTILANFFESATTITTKMESTVSEKIIPLNISTENWNVTKVGFVDKLSNQIRDILKHLENPQPIGFPGQTVLGDPLKVPNKTVNFGLLTGYFYNMTVHGLSNFTVDGINTHLDQLEVYIMIKMKNIYILGNCTVDTVFGLSSRGPFNITLWNVTAEGTVFLVVNPDGTVRANRSISDMTYESLTVSTSGGGAMETALSSAGSVILASLKPYILDQIDERINREVNAQLQNVPKLPAIVEHSPVDLAIIEARRFVRNWYEPFIIEKIVEHDSEFLAVTLGPITVHGLSKFARVGSVGLKITNGTVIISLRMITGRLHGHCKFFYDFGKVGAARAGRAEFSVGHLQFEAKVNQSMNFRKKPILDDLQLETGKIFVHLDGKGKLDYLLELTMELLPQMLRYMIIDALEEPIKQKIQQEILDTLDVEKQVDDHLSLLESLLVKSQ